MTSTTQYFKKSMNAIYEIDDGAGTSISDGNITTNSISTSNFNTASLTCETIDASTGNITTLNTTTGNLDTLNSTNGSITTATIPTLNTDTITNNGSITTAFLNMKNGGFVYNGDTSTYSEQYINTNTNIYMYTLYPPINKAIWIINGNHTLTLDDTKILVPRIDSTTINNSGTITSDILTATTINNSGTATTGTLASTTINNSGTSTTATANITTANITTANITNANITNSITVPGISTTYATFQNIQPQTNSTATNLYTSSTSNLALGGSYTGTIDITGSTVSINTTSSSGKTYISKNGNYSVEAGITTTTSYLDFHSSNTTSDYDARIISTGGTSTAGQGTLNIQANIIQLNSNPFRFIPWTNFVDGNALQTFMNYPPPAQCPIAYSLATLKYRYSVIGNTLYIQYHFYQEFAGTAGTGFYQYRFPSGFNIDMTNLSYSSYSSANGTKIGNCEVRRLGTSNALGSVYLSNYANVGLGLLLQIGSNPQSSTNYSYVYSNFAVDFDAMVPLS